MYLLNAKAIRYESVKKEEIYVKQLRGYADDCFNVMPQLHKT
jgi:hypothetical protein